MDEHSLESAPQLWIRRVRGIPEQIQGHFTRQTRQMINRVGQRQYGFSQIEGPGTHRAVDGDDPLAVLQQQQQITVIVIVHAMGDTQLGGEIRNECLIGLHAGIKGVIFYHQMQIPIPMEGKRGQCRGDELIHIAKAGMTGDLAVAIELKW